MRIDGIGEERSRKENLQAVRKESQNPHPSKPKGAPPGLVRKSWLMITNSGRHLQFPRKAG